jgi:parallel beta helix pectate lyase-like protein
MHRVHCRLMLVLLTLLVPRAAEASALELHVATSGSDDNPGTEAAPYASLAAARNAARNADGAVTVWVHDGLYAISESVRLLAPDGGGPMAPIHYRAKNPGKARLSGGRVLEPAAFAMATNEARLARIPKVAHGSVVWTDLKARGFADQGAYPDNFRTALAVPELFFNGERMTVARWPNKGWATIEKVVESGPAPWRKHASDALGAFTFSGDHAARWARVDQLWLEGYWCFDWAAETIRVRSVDPDTRRITLAARHVYGLGSGNPAPRRYRAVNLLEELDQPGEYYIDRGRGQHTLYFWPPAPLPGAEIVLSQATEPLLALQDASHLTFSGFVLEYCVGTALTVAGGSNVRIAGCTIRNAGQSGLEIDGGTNHTVQSCDIHHNGTGGLHIQGGERKTLTRSGHRVVNNRIYQVSERMRTAAYNIRVGGVGVTLANNEIHDAPHQAILLSGNDHLFELNNIHHVGVASDDCGAFYMGRNPSDRGTMIRHNYWHEIGSAMTHGSCAIYFDDGDGGQTVHGNVFYQASGGRFGAVFCHGGHDNLVSNNIFIECDQAIGAAPWNDANWKQWLGEPLWQTRLLQEVDITAPPFTDRYPQLHGYFTPQGLRMNRAERNVAVRCNNFVVGNWDIDHCFVTQEDPGFVDRESQNFSLREDAALFERIPGFEPIPFKNIGLVKDEWRAVLD